MLQLYDPNESDDPRKPWLVQVFEDNKSPRYLGLTWKLWLLNAVLWIFYIAVAWLSYTTFH